MADRSLNELRARMDVINRRLSRLLDRRARLVRRIARAKAALGLPRYDAERERRMMRQVLAAAGDGYDATDIERIFAAIFRASRRVVDQVAGSVSGPKERRRAGSRARGRSRTRR